MSWACLWRAMLSKRHRLGKYIFNFRWVYQDVPHPKLRSICSILPNIYTADLWDSLTWCNWNVIPTEQRPLSPYPGPLAANILFSASVSFTSLNDFMYVESCSLCPSVTDSFYLPDCLPGLSTLSQIFKAFNRIWACNFGHIQDCFDSHRQF